MGACVGPDLRLGRYYKGMTMEFTAERGWQMSTTDRVSPKAKPRLSDP